MALMWEVKTYIQNGNLIFKFDRQNLELEAVLQLIELSRE
jgi:uncharacterized protein (DUF1697 family)